ncbi:hypothetical protein RRG08_004697 [Elysia crispata]|uniref:Uncharacterized protein n=1 Tax=Elysia crispata TaxID=231223 RepID=A0AAE1A7T4_9GAST|nr:hypothetical protein RRG08_004697 [Elysia crispata]
MITGVPWKDNKTGRYNKGKNCVLIVRKRNQDAHFLDQSCFRRAYYICEYYTTCADQTYGANCSEKCSTNCRGPNNDCEDVKGFCIFGCDDGYQGEKCEKACNPQTFGENCSETCSKTCRGLNNTCNNVNGFCNFGCTDGYQGQRCDKPCNSKKFGANCSETCSKMCSGPKKACNNVNGFCISGCIDGYEGERCQDQIASSLGQIGIKNNFIKTNETDDRKSPNDLPLKSLAAVSALILSVCLLFAIIFVQVEARRKNGTENAVGQNSGSANEAWCENGTLDAVGQSTESITNKEVANQSQVQLSNIPELLEDNHDNDNPHRQERMSTKEERTRQESYLPEPMQYPFKKIRAYTKLLGVQNRKVSHKWIAKELRQARFL